MTNNKTVIVPATWEAEKLGDFVINEKGKKPKNLSPNQSEAYSLPYVDIEAFEEGIIKAWTDGVGCRLCFESDLLMVWDGSRSGLVGKGVNGALGSTLVRINFPSMVNDYAYYFLQSKYQQINSRAKGSGTPHVDPDLLWNYTFPIAPLNEQQRIVAKIEELFSELEKGVESLKAAREQLAVYRQSVLKAAFEGRLTESWRKEHADELESASELLERIQKEREARYRQQLAEWEQAVAEWEQQGGKASGKKKPARPRKPKELPPLTADEFANLPKLPEGWALDRIGNLLEIVNGNTPKGISNIPNGELPFYRVSDMNREGNEQWMDNSETYVTKSEARNLNLAFFPRGTVIFPKRGGAILTNKKRLLSRDAAFDLNTMGVVNQLPSIDGMFVWWWFTKLDLSKIYDGSNVPQINNKNVEPLAFPLCSLGPPE